MTSNEPPKVESRSTGPSSQHEATGAPPAVAEEGMCVRFWGVRGSYPVPGPRTVKYGGNTSCVEIRSHTHRIILDAGTGIIALGDAIMSEYRQRQHGGPPGLNSHLPVTILLSHTHFDHIQALPFFQPAYLNDTWLYVFGPQVLGIDVRESIAQIMTDPYCPVRLEELNSNKIFKNLAETDRLIFRGAATAPEHYGVRQEAPACESSDLVVTIMRSYAHPKDGVYVFKIAQDGRRVVYATDTEGYAGGDARLIEFAQGAEILIHDAQYTREEYADPLTPKQGFGHSTIDMACEVAQKAGVGKLLLFHHDPRHSDDFLAHMEQYARTIFPASYAAHEGMEIRL